MVACEWGLNPDREQHGSIPEVGQPRGQYGWVYAQLHLWTL